jgi:hypothetical protein
MMDQPDLPKLPPMPAPVSSPPDSAAMPPPLNGTTTGAVNGSARSSPVAAKRLRQMVTFVAGGGFGLVAVIGVAQLVLRPELTPTHLLATMEAQTELGIMNQKLGHDVGKAQITEAQYQEAIAKAQRDGQAKAELVFQQKLAVVQADKERLVGAYQTLYQRANLIAQAAIQLETIAQQFRQQLMTMTNGGRAAVIGFKDIFCGLGSPEACASAHEDRSSMISEADSLTRGDASKRVRELLSGIPDPASVIVREDEARHGVTSIKR